MSENGAIKTESIWKYATTALGSILVGILLSTFSGLGQQHQLDNETIEITKLQTEVVQLQVDVARISEHLGVAAHPAGSPEP